MGWFIAAIVFLVLGAIATIALVFSETRAGITRYSGRQTFRSNNAKSF